MQIAYKYIGKFSFNILSLSFLLLTSICFQTHIEKVEVEIFQFSLLDYLKRKNSRQKMFKINSFQLFVLFLTTSHSNQGRRSRHNLNQ